MEGKKGFSFAAYKSAFTLCGITLVAGLALGGIYQLTKGPIEKAELAAQAEAYAAVCPGAESFDVDETLEAAIASLTAEDGTVADGQFGGIVYESAYAALDGSGNRTGCVVNVTSKEGFGGDITISLGFDEEGTITGMEFLTINETAGLGMRAEEESFRSQFVGDNVEAFELTKDAASSDDQIQALSGATITSNAVTNAVNAALYLVNSAAQ
ncbi:RnfABCDGE type electron transport complex subunit G [Marvinbryantia formatexigens]|uniref:RnfABCDGE type electron transport complex subunit G n=1 Tax=Marvinbryantia formatexigens TaxID=168384 RepID=UPI003A7F246B